MGWQRPAARVLALTVWFAVLLAPTAYAETDIPPLPVLQVYGPVDERDPGIERVLEQAMSLALERQGPFSVATAAFRDVGGEERLALDLADRQGFDLLVIGAYQVVDDGLRLDARLLEVATRLPIAEVSVTREIDLRLDRIAEAATDALLTAAAPTIARLIEALEVELLAPVPPDQPPEVALPVVEPPEAPPAPESEPERIPFEGPRYRVGAGFLLVAPMGRYADYFGPGPGGELSLHRTFERMRLGFSAGLLFSTPAQSDTGEYARGFIPLLLEAGLPIATTGAVTWEASAGAGAAIRLAGDSPISDRLAPALAAWRVRISAIIPVSARVSLVPHLTGMGAMQFYEGAPNGDAGGGVDHLLWFVPGAMASFAW
ncbi:MAG: hypothetical protein EA403_04375 [Spirochaetaceae bacterium]|nr:MAG: hypothetical protein EA403_04375 [Spirochaetaceae bacterium]